MMNLKEKIAIAIMMLFLLSAVGLVIFLLYLSFTISPASTIIILTILGMFGAVGWAAGVLNGEW